MRLFKVEANQMTFILLPVYTFMNVLIGSMFVFYQYNNYTSSQI